MLPPVAQKLGVTPHVSQNLGRRGGSAIDGRTTHHPGYRLSQKKRKRIEECFGWLKAIALLRKATSRSAQSGTETTHSTSQTMRNRKKIVLLINFSAAC